MPELPEVETVRRGLVATAIGAKVVDVHVRWPKIIQDPMEIGDFSQIMPGQSLQAVERRGKYLIFIWNNYIWLSHLRMEGKYFVVPSDQDLDKHDHVILALDDGRDLRYNDVRKFGRIQIWPLNQKENAIAQLGLGPEPEDLDANYLYQRLQATNRMIKPVLLDQKILAGLGNIYADEVLFLAKINPQRPASSLSQEEVAKLTSHIKALLAQAVAAGGTTIRTYTDSFGQSGHFQFDLNVYGRQGLNCPCCGHKIEKIKLAQRGTHFCPNCQPIPVEGE
ncbi:hypothetical protein AWM75_06265 [Aerococcus urinaehominis]|uniref:Formamidopyrimidine-DNA glycosylase n=1 Tax=Aerococcus urinaehominis TaxID=128944 RepID=A0A120IAZ0_9LACT|nr:DNA-formamidopyrimidine glycosylase [Aerococcus urinaehominis]AMB99609.1 hypothetical protein AWM75_06265 [Aerococcus urinaehominis]SDL87307.1 DNA-(apurinic or apyrimidinic site) lyase [Aerococcus urinaehominis]